MQNCDTKFVPDYSCAFCFTCEPVGSGSGEPPYEPSLDFSDERNSQYIPVVGF